MKKYSRIKPFKLCVLQNFPFIEADFDSLTNYELLCKVVEYLNKTITSQNELIENINELNNWFNNLDVQDEINNKLDEMAESGQLNEIIAQYLQLAGVLAYDTVEYMKNATNLVNGSIAKTLGNTTYNDGYGSFYKIRTITSDDTVDGINIIALTISSTLIAEKINNKELFVTPEMFGCVGDGINDDTKNFISCIDYAKNKNINIISSKNKIYLVNNTIDISNVYINLNHATIKTNTNIDIFKIDTNNNTTYTHVENIIIDCNSVASCGLKIINCRRSKFNNLDFINIHNVGIDVMAGYENMFDNINMQTTEFNNTATGIKVETSDCHYTNITMTNLSTAFYIMANGNLYDKIHCWIGESSLITNSIMFDLNVPTESIINMSNIYSDTYRYTFKYENNYNIYLYLDNFNLQFNTAIYTSNLGDSYVLYCNTDSQPNFTRFTNSFMLGLQNIDNTKSYLTNRDNYYGLIINSDLNKVDYNQIFELTNIDTNLTVIQNSVYKTNNTITIDFIASFDSTIGSNDNYIQFTPIGLLDYYTAPKTAITSSCFITTSRWEFYTAQQGYLYISDKNASQIQVQARVPKNNSGTNYIFIHITYGI